MQRAGVPKSCWPISCADTGRAYITTWAEEAASRAEAMQAKSSVYLQVKAKDSQTTAMTNVELFARQAVAKKLVTKVLPFARLIQLLRQGDDTYREERSNQNSLNDVFAKGVIAIPCIYPFSDTRFVFREWDEAMAFLTAHIYEGGILVTSGNFALTRQMKAGLPLEFEKALFENALVVEV